MSHCDLNALGWRVEGGSGGGSVAYSGDTAPCESLVEMARDVGCLVCECAFPESSKVPVHMTPESVRRAAEACRPGKLVLTHLYPEVLQPGAIESVFEGYAGDVVIAHDGLRINLGP